VMAKPAGRRARQLAFKGRILSVEVRSVFAVVRLPWNRMKFKIVMFGRSSHTGRCGGTICLRCRSQMRQIPKDPSY
jgi:hypothetical protein